MSTSMAQMEPLGLAPGSSEQAVDMPVDFLRQVFNILSTPDACSCACTCTLWRTLSLDIWPARAERRWSYGWTKPRWQLLRDQGRHLQLYAERHQIDTQAVNLLEDLPWPLKRDQALKHLQELGLDCFDCLMQTSQGEGPLGIGRRYWSWYALTQLQVSRCSAELAKIMAEQQAADWSTTEQGALLIAQVHYPASDMAYVSLQLDALADELKRRMDEEGVDHKGRKALELLNGLLFGEPPPPGSPARGSTPPRRSTAPQQHAGLQARQVLPYCLLSCPRQQYRCTLDPPQEAQEGVTAAAAAQGHAHGDGAFLEGVGGEVLVPPPGYGLGLKGNRDDYRNPRNSLLPDVLSSRKGIPISLSLIHMAVGRRAGLPIQLINMPMHVISCLVPEDAADTEAGSSGGGCGSGSGSASCSGAAGGDETRRAGSGAAGVAAAAGLGHEPRATQRDARGNDIGAVGVTSTASSSRDLTGRALRDGRGGQDAEAPGVLYIDAYGGGRIMDREQLRTVLELVKAVNPRVPAYLGQKAATAVELNDFEAALSAMHQLEQMLQAANGPARQAPQHAMFTRHIHEQQLAYHDSCMRQMIRTPAVLFCVGNVIRHKIYHYRAVIVGWDLRCNMEEEWIQQMGVDALPGGRNQPFYRVLVDIRDRTAQNTYVAQCNVQLMVPTVANGSKAVVHPDVGQYFDAFDGTGYIPNAYLQYRFPGDVVGMSHAEEPHLGSKYWS